MDVLASHWSFHELLIFFAPKLFYSIICGGIIGLERELKNKAAGIKTNILICVGATLYTSISVLISVAHSRDGYYGDPARIAAQIVSGIGFLGGGTIIQSRGTILGLTTAATIWVVAAIGLCIGIGHPDIALFVSFSVVLILIASNWFEDRILGRSLSFAVEMVVRDPESQVRGMINHALARNDLVLVDFELRHLGEDTALTVRYRGHRGANKRFLLELWGTPGIREIRQI